MEDLVMDNLQMTQRSLERAVASADVVVSTGGVSVGDHDHVKAAIESLGGQLDFWRVAIRPGKPFVHGALGGRSFFGLPGNPVSAFVTFLLMVRPALIRLQGGRETSMPELRVRLGGDGQVRLTGRQGSHVLSSLAAANALLDVPAGSDWEAGRGVSVLRID